MTSSKTLEANGGEIANLLGADARAILAAVQRAVARGEVLASDFERESEHIREVIQKLQASIERTEKAAWAARSGATEAKLMVEGTKNQIDQLIQAWASMRQLNDSLWRAAAERDDAIARRMKAFEENLMTLADRTAAEVIRLTIDGVKLKDTVAKTSQEIETKVDASRQQAEAERKKIRRELASLTEIDHWDEITHNSFIAEAQRRRADEDFVREAARAGLGLRVHTWRTILKWGSIVVASLFTGGLLMQLLVKFVFRQ